MELGLNNDEKVYIKPNIYIIKVNMPHLMAASGRNTLTDANTQTNKPAPETGGSEEHEGGDDLDAAKRWEFNFDEF